MAKLVRVEKPGGGFALGRVGGKLITDADGAPCCCGPNAGWRRAVYCNDAQVTFYVPTSSRCVGGGSLSGQTILYGGACYYVEPATIADEDLPTGAVKVEDAEFDCSPTDCTDPVCVGPLPCCKASLAGFFDCYVNGVDRCQPNLAIIVGSAPMVSTVYQTQLQASATNINGVAGRNISLDLNVDARLTMQVDPLSGGCIADTLRVVTDDTRFTGVSREGVAFNGVLRQDPNNYDSLIAPQIAGPRFEHHDSSFNLIPFPPGADANYNASIQWRGSRFGSTASRFRGGIFPLFAPDSGAGSPTQANSKPDLVPWMTRTAGQQHTFALNISASSQVASVSESILIGLPDSGTAWRVLSQSASVTYTWTPLLAYGQLTLNTVLDNLPGATQTGTPVQTHTVSLNSYVSMGFEASGPCTPTGQGAGLPPGFDPATGLPIGSPLLKGGCCGQ